MTKTPSPPEGEAPDDEQVTISFSVPAWVVADRQMSVEVFACWVRLAAAMFRYARREVSLGTAAALAGLSQAAFMRALDEAQLDTFVIDWDDLDRELVRAGVIPAPPHDDAG